MNSFGSISNGRGDIFEFRRGGTNGDANTRLYSLMHFKVGGNEDELVVNGHADAGEFAGVNMTAPPEPIATTKVEDLVALTVRAKNLTLALSPAVVNLWAKPSTAFRQGDLLIEEAGQDRAMPLPVGGTQKVIAQCLETKTTGAGTELVQVLLLAPGAPAGAHPIRGFGIDAVVDDRHLVTTWGNHNNGAYGLFVAPANGFIKNLFAKLKTAAGGGKAVTYTVRRSTDGGATWADTALTCTITDPAVTAEDITHRVAVTRGDLLGIRVTSADPGAAVGSSAVFQYE